MSDITIQTPAVSGPLPDPIVRALRRLVRRARMVALVRGLCAVAAVAAGSTLAAMAVDAGFTLFVAWPRWALSLSALGLTLLTAILFLIRPLVRTFTLTGVARAIESRHPELQERISSAIELLSTPDAPHLRGSAALIAALAAEATQDASGVQARREVTLRSARPYLLAATIAGVLLASAFVLWPRQAGQAWNRVVAPYKDLPSVFADQLTITPGDIAIAAGEPLTVEVQVANKAVNRAQFRRAGSDRDTVTDMTPLAAKENDWPRFAVTCPPSSESFRYRIYAGDAWSRYYTVTVVPRPVIERLDALYDYPAYTGRGPQLENTIGGDLRALAGTRITLTAATNTPVTAAALLVNDEPIAEAQVIALPDGAAACRFQFTLGKRIGGAWAIRLTKEIGGRAFTSVSDSHKIEAIADGRPVVKITSPENLTLQLKPDDKLPVFFAAGDDFGLATAELLVDVDGRRQFPTPLPIEEPLKTKAVVGKTVLDLTTLNAMGAGVITFRIHVTDNLPPELDGPQEAFSDLHTIRMDAKAFIYGRQVVLAEELAIRESLELALRELQEAKKDSAQLRKVFKLSDANDAAATTAVVPGVNTERIDRVVAHTGLADTAIREVLPRLTGDNFAPIADRLGALADNHISKAGNLTAQIKLAEDARSRGELADEADFQVDRGISIISDMLKELTVLAQMLQRAQELADLAEKQAELADEMQAMLPQPDPDGPASQPASQPTTDAASQPASAPASQPGAAAKRNLMPPQEWQKQEGQVAKRLGELMKQSPKAMKQALSRGGGKTKDLAVEARKLAGQQASVAELTNRVTPVTDQDRILRTQAEEQAAMAKRLAADTATSAPSTQAADAAEQLRNGQAEAALKALGQVQGSLAQQADKLNRQVMTSQLARTAESVAQQQRSIADQAADAVREHQAQQKSAQASAQQLAQSNQENQQAAAKVQSTLAELQQRQQKLAASAEALQSALEKNPATPAAGKIKPSELMKAAAQNMTGDKLPQAAEASRNAAQQANQLSTQAVADASKAKPESLDPEIKAAAAKAVEAKKAVETTAKTAASAQQTAAEAATKAAAAAAKAKDAQSKADQLAVAATQPAAGAQPPDPNFVQAARKLADTTRNEDAASQGSADALKANAENAKAAAAAAAKASADADKNHADAQKKKDDFAKAAAEAKKLADHAAEVAAAQKKIDTDLAELTAGPAAKLVQSAAEAKSAQQEQAQHAKAADAALERLAQLAKGQQDVQKQAADLAKAVEKATPEAQQAAAKSNPAAAMEQARSALANKQAPQAVQTSAQAAKTAKELAESLRAADAATSDAAANAAKHAQAAAKMQEARTAAQDAQNAHEAAQAAAAAAANAQAAKTNDAPAKAQAAKDAADQAARNVQAAEQAAKDAAQAARNAAAATQPADPQAPAAQQAAQAAAKAIEAAQAAQDQANAQQTAAQQAAKDAQAAAQAAKVASAADKAAANAKAAEAQQASAKATAAAKQSSQAAQAAQRQAQSAQDAAVSQAEKLAANENNQRSAAAAKLAEAARAQEELRKRVETTAAARAKSADALKNEQLAQLRAEQSKISKEMGKLADKVKTLAPQNDRLDTQAARSAIEAAERIESALTPQAVAAAEQAARDSTELAQRLGAEVDPAPASQTSSSPAANKTVKGSTKQTPDQVAAEMDEDQLETKRADMTAQAGQLAQRQQLVARQLKALAENRPLDLVPPRQDRLNHDTTSLADDIDLMRLFAEDLIPDKAARQDANQAAAQVEAAAAAQKQASASLTAGAPQTAEPAQRAAAAALGQTAESLERLGQKMAELASKYPSDPNEEDTGHLDDAFEAAKRAARKPEMRDIELARKLLEELSKQSAEAMAAMGMPTPSQQNQQMPSSKSTARSAMGQVPVELLADELKAAGIRPGDWGLLPGELRDEILQSASNEGPQEYRQLIKRYLEELSKRGGKR